MAVRFKFRSSSTFDSIDIGNQPFISIRDLKSEIIKKKHLNLSQDFDLVFSDALSGQEYKDESIKIPSGSSVIIKRVPAASTPSLRAGDASAGCFDGRVVNHANILEPPAQNAGVSSLDDFGVDLCPLPDDNLPSLGNLQSTKIPEEDFMVARCSEELIVRCNELDATYRCQHASKDSSANEVSTLVMQSKPKTEEQVELGRTLPPNHLAMERNNMPSELKCSLCKDFFKEAVMIPCCQHSFCEKCIRLALAAHAKCPVCSSTKCKAEDLLPNVSLRQAIERFLESQLLLNGSENDLHRYAPDGESGIQVKELSYAATVKKRDLQLNCSATRRSNQLLQHNWHHPAHLTDMKCERVALGDVTEFEGENEPQNVIRTDQQEADSCVKQNQPCVATQGVERNFPARSRLQRGQQTCYRCGSPDHFIRDCPIAAASQANRWNGDASVAGPAPGCALPYWPGAPPNVRPFVNTYGGPGMMMYNATMPPITPFGFPPFAPSMCGTYAFPSGHMAMGVGTMAPAMGNHCLQPSHLEALLGRDQVQRFHSGNSERERTGNQVYGLDTNHDCREVYHPNDNLPRRSEGKHRSHNDSDEDAYSDSKRQEKVSSRKGGRDPRISQPDKSSSEREMRDCKSRVADDRHEKQHGSSRMDVEKRAPYGSDSKKESIKRRRTEHDERRPDKEFHHHSRSSVEHSYSSDSARQRREESSHRRRHIKERAKSNKEHRHDGERMTRYSDDDYGGYYHGHKQKRFQ